MALNIPLTSDENGQFPLPFQGEVFMLTRDKITLTLKDGARDVPAVGGRLFLTNLRIVFLVAEKDRMKAQAESYEFPFRGLWDEKLNQPIFHANNITTNVQYYDDQPFQGTLSVKLIFKQGGVGTFLSVFNSVLRETRVQLQREERSSQQAPPPMPAFNPESTPFEQQFLQGDMQHNAAFVDPSDPSRLYATQPVVAGSDRRSAPPAWAPSASGMRQRRGN